MTDETRSRTRRGRRKPLRPRSEICRRDTCGRPVTAPDRGYCTGLCRQIDRELSKARRVCEALGAEGLQSELWAEAVALSDTWTQYQELDRRISDAAAECGITPEQFAAIKGQRPGHGSDGTRQ